MAIETGLSNRAVVVTGAAKGIGRATALAFAREGARVAAWDVAPAGALAAELVAAGAPDASVEAVDVTIASSVEGAMSGVARRWGGVDVLVSNAGVVRDAQLVKVKDGAVVSVLSDEQWASVLDVNLTGVFHAARAAVPHMLAARRGVILNASSVVGLYGNFGQTNYVATKAGVVGMTKTWARELGRHGIRVNAVAPGFIETEILASVPEKVVQGMVARTPLGRMGAVADVAAAYVWLASDAAAYVTGAVLSVDGGLVVGT